MQSLKESDTVELLSTHAQVWVISDGGWGWHLCGRGHLQPSEEGQEQGILKGRHFPSRGISRYTGPDVVVSFLNLRNSRRAGVASIEERKL